MGRGEEALGGKAPATGQRMEGQAGQAWVGDGHKRRRAHVHSPGVQMRACAPLTWALQGGQIRGTFWRTQAERWSQALEEGKVYVFERFSVKPANKAYSSVRNDYEIAFTDK